MNYNLKFLGWFWSITSIALTLWGIKEMWSILTNSYGVDRYALIATFIGVVFFLLCFIAGRALLSSKPYGNLMILILSVLMLLYGIIFVWFGGFEDVSNTYSLIVLIMTTVSIYGLITFIRLRIRITNFKDREHNLLFWFISLLIIPVFTFIYLLPFSLFLWLISDLFGLNDKYIAVLTKVGVLLCFAFAFGTQFSLWKLYKKIKLQSVSFNP
jgi:hypothetical protein